MNDQNLMQDLLITVKETCDLFLHATIESGTPEVRTVFNNSLFECLRIQNEVYSKMEAKGWYPENRVQPTKINQVEQKFAQPE
ncbi:MAG: spore coat protein [Bacilli bacterium]|nr:spore coat protein [Bacilli bacterium]MDD4388907.1 spore coat protein [Bacilli bacterium]